MQNPKVAMICTSIKKLISQDIKKTIGESSSTLDMAHVVPNMKNLES